MVKKLFILTVSTIYPISTFSVKSDLDKSLQECERELDIYKSSLKMDVEKGDILEVYCSEKRIRQLNKRIENLKFEELLNSDKNLFELYELYNLFKKQEGPAYRRDKVKSVFAANKILKFILERFIYVEGSSYRLDQTRINQLSIGNKIALIKSLNECGIIEWNLKDYKNAECFFSASEELTN